jgi:hypothetical protein
MTVVVPGAWIFIIATAENRQWRRLFAEELALSPMQAQERWAVHSLFQSALKSPQSYPLWLGVQEISPLPFQLIIAEIASSSVIFLTAASS